MNEYHIILEEVLNPATRKKYLEELREKGWIHTNTPCRKKKDDTYFLAITCTEELLGKIIAYLLSKVGWLIVERVTDKIINKSNSIELQQILPF